MKDLESLQAMKVKAARWVLGARRLGWSTTKNFKKLGWLTIQQEVTYKSVRMAIKVLQTQQPRFLFEKVPTPRLIMRTGEWHEIRERRKITKEELTKMKQSTRKSWAVRATRWMAQIPPLMLTTCVRKNSSKKELKDWCLENIPTTGDRILRGRSLEEGRPEAGNEYDGGKDNSGEGSGQKRKQPSVMRKWLQGNRQYQTREGGQEPVQYLEDGRQQNELKRQSEVMGVSQDINITEKEVEVVGKYKSMAAEAEQDVATTVLAKLLTKRCDEKEQLKRAVLILTIILLVSGSKLERHGWEEVLKHHSLENKFVQHKSCQEKAEKERRESSREGIG